MAKNLTIRARIAALEEVVLEFLGIDDWADELIAPAALVKRARELVGHKEATLVTAAGEQQWTGTLPCGRVSHSDALKQIAILNDNKLQGHKDWRLPEVWELFSRVDHTRQDPATNDADVKSGFHWSNTAYAPYPAVYAWGVFFYFGFVYYYYRDYNGFVRAVRGPVAARPGQ